MLDYEKSLGKTSMRKLLMKGGDLQVLEFATADMKKVEKYGTCRLSQSARPSAYWLLHSPVTGSSRFPFSDFSGTPSVC